MKVIEQFNKTDKPLISFEILPPLKGKSIQSMYRILDLLMEFNPPFINVTYHRAEYKFKLLPSGLYEKVYTRKRPGTVGICAAIQYKYGVDAVPHLVCGGFNRNETEDALVDLNYLGVNNVLLLRGDAVKGERSFMPEANGHKNALELVEQVVNMNRGNYLEEDLRNPVETEFCIGVAGYPEKHQEAPNTTSDLNYLKRKIDAGADYIVTQMFFDNQKYFDFVKDCRAAGITVPIIPGIKPITTQSQIRRLPGIFNISL
ncbi:MAG: methylenetetrahydrofolate reductase, partial [Chitinophagales bacterium]